MCRPRALGFVTFVPEGASVPFRPSLTELFLAGVVLALGGVFASPAVAADRPLGEPLAAAAATFGLSQADVAAIRAAGGEFACPGERDGGARLNAWLISDRQILTNAHAIIEAEDAGRGPYIRQPVARCTFVSYLDLGAARPPTYAVSLSGLAAVLRRGAEAPVDPTDNIGGDLVRLRLARPVPRAVPLVFDPSPVVKGDALLLVSRVPTPSRSAALPGDDLLIARCTVTSLDPPSPGYGRGAITDCNGAPGMSAGLLLARIGDKLIAKGFLVALEYVRTKGSKEERLIGAHNLLFDATFHEWLGGDCAFWPAALRVSFCGVVR
jgi:hypothetical protein